MAEVSYIGVPQVEPNTSAPNDYQHINATADSFGGQIAKGVEQFGAGATHAGRFFGQVAADDAANQFQDLSTKILHGDPNKTVPGPDGKPQPDTGYMGLQGDAALRARPDVEKNLDDQLKNIRAGLTTPEQQLHFDNYSRRYRAGLAEKIGTHADNQAKQWYGQVNQATEKLALDHISFNVDNPKELAAGAADLIAARVKQAQLRGGGPELVAEAIASAKRDALKAQLEVISVAEPARALRILEKNREIAGGYYQPLAQQFRARADRQMGDEAGSRAIGDARMQNSDWFRQRSGSARVEGMHPEFANRLRQAAMDWETETGNKAKFESLSRTTQEQAVLRWKYEHGVGGLAAPAGQSLHEQGAAADIPDGPFQKWMHQNAPKYGLTFLTGPSFNKDPGHIQLPRGELRGGVQNAMDVQGIPTPVGIVNQGAQAFVKADAYKSVLDDPTLSHEARTHAISYINQTLTAQDIADNQNIKARKEASDKAANGYVSRLLLGDNLKGIVEEIARDPNLDHAVRMHLGEAAKKKSGEDVEDAALSYGPGFWGAYKGITAPPGDPARIADPTQLLSRAGPGGDLTLAGVQKLSQTMQQTQKSVNDTAVHSSKVGLMNYAKGKLSFEADTGPIKLRDPKGEAIFNAQFIPKFESAYDTWVKAGKNPWEFLTQENVDKMITGMRSKREMDLERMRATGEVAPDGPQQPLPAAPVGVNPAGWASVIKAVPQSQSGKPWPTSNWAAVINTLRAAPPEVGKENLDAADNAMKLTPQERSLYDRHLTNLKGPGGVDNPDGSRSTLFQLSFEQNGKTYNIPTVWDGKILEPDAAIERARKEGLEKFPSYANEQEAEQRYQQMHAFMERDTSAHLTRKNLITKFNELFGSAGYDAKEILQKLTPSAPTTIPRPGAFRS